MIQRLLLAIAAALLTIDPIYANSFDIPYKLPRDTLGNSQGFFRFDLDGGVLTVSHYSKGIRGLSPVPEEYSLAGAEHAPDIIIVAEGSFYQISNLSLKEWATNEFKLGSQVSEIEIRVSPADGFLIGADKPLILQGAPAVEPHTISTLHPEIPLQVFGPEGPQKVIGKMLIDQARLEFTSDLHDSATFAYTRSLSPSGAFSFHLNGRELTVKHHQNIKFLRGDADTLSRAPEAETFQVQYGNTTIVLDPFDLVRNKESVYVLPDNPAQASIVADRASGSPYDFHFYRLNVLNQAVNADPEAGKGKARMLRLGATNSYVPTKGEPGKEAIRFDYDFYEGRSKRFGELLFSLEGNVVTIKNSVSDPLAMGSRQPAPLAFDLPLSFRVNKRVYNLSLPMASLATGEDSIVIKELPVDAPYVDVSLVPGVEAAKFHHASGRLLQRQKKNAKGSCGGSFGG